MPFCGHLKDAVMSYCESDLPEHGANQKMFSFILDKDLKDRIVAELEGARFAYKLFEGLQASDELMRFQVRSQLLSYASLYEASIEYVLYQYYADSSAVTEMGQFTALNRISIPTEKQATLQKELSHDGKTIIPCYEGIKRKEKNTIRFEEKVEAAVKLSLLWPFLNNTDGRYVDLPEELKTFYSYRNGIHLIAEKRKDIKYDIEMSKRAFWRLKPFCQQIKERLEIDGKV